MVEQDKTYNGWSNYETWRIQLEFCDEYADSLAKDVGMHAESCDTIHDLADHFKETVEEFVESAFEDLNDSQRLIIGWADGFMQEVNWKEIAEHAADSYPQLLKEAKAEQD